MALGRYLGVKGLPDDLRGPMPPEWLVLLVCREFGCVPSVARRELEEANPHGYVERLLEMSNFEQIKRALDHASDASHKPTGRMADLVDLTEASIVEELGRAGKL